MEPFFWRDYHLSFDRVSNYLTKKQLNITMLAITLLDLFSKEIRTLTENGFLKEVKLLFKKVIWNYFKRDNLSENKYVMNTSLW